MGKPTTRKNIATAGKVVEGVGRRAMTVYRGRSEIVQQAKATVAGVKNMAIRRRRVEWLGCYHCNGVFRRKLPMLGY